MVTTTNCKKDRIMDIKKFRQQKAETTGFYSWRPDEESKPIFCIVNSIAPFNAKDAVTGYPIENSSGMWIKMKTDNPIIPNKPQDKSDRFHDIEIRTIALSNAIAFIGDKDYGWNDLLELSKKLTNYIKGVS